VVSNRTRVFERRAGSGAPPARADYLVTVLMAVMGLSHMSRRASNDLLRVLASEVRAWQNVPDARASRVLERAGT